MVEQTITTDTARRFYNRLGAGYDLAERYDSRAKERALTLLGLTAGLRVLNAGPGTGREQAKIQRAVGLAGVTVGLDLSRVMLRLTGARSSGLLCEGDARMLPFASASFDRILASYVLDLLPAPHLLPLLEDFRRVLKPAGKLVLVSLTNGVNLPSRALIRAWKIIYAFSPTICGGCRPLQLAEQVKRAGFAQVEREVIVQLAVPSEIIAAQRR